MGLWLLHMAVGNSIRLRLWLLPLNSFQYLNHLIIFLIICAGFYERCASANGNTIDGQQSFECDNKLQLLNWLTCPFFFPLESIMQVICALHMQCLQCAQSDTSRTFVVIFDNCLNLSLKINCFEKSTESGTEFNCGKTLFICHSFFTILFMVVMCH